MKRLITEIINKYFCKHNFKEVQRIRFNAGKDKEIGIVILYRCEHCNRTEKQKFGTTW